MTEPLLTARDVAERLGVSTETVLRWTRRGVLLAIRLPGGALRFRPQVVERLLEEWETGAATRSRASESGGDSRDRIVTFVPLANPDEEEEDDAS